VLGGPLEDAQSAAAGPADADLADEELADEELAESDPAGPGAEAAMTGAVGTRPGSARPAPAEGGEPKDAELSAAAVADAAITGAGRPDLEPADFGADAEAVTEALSEAADSPPLPRYDELSIPQLRGRLRTLDETTLEQLVGYERVHAARAPYLTMLENRLTTLRSR
jgi:hypothetical protein